MYRTHTCGALRADNVNQTVTLAGWVQKVRNLGAMTFIDLRDRYGLTQIVVEEHSPAEARETAARVIREWVMRILAGQETADLLRQLVGYVDDSIERDGGRD